MITGSRYPDGIVTPVAKLPKDPTTEFPHVARTLSAIDTVNSSDAVTSTPTSAYLLTAAP